MSTSRSSSSCAALALALCALVLGACAKSKDHPPELVLGNDTLPVTCDALVPADAGARVGPGRAVLVDDEPAACFVAGQLCPLPSGFAGASCPSEGGAVIAVASCTSDYYWVERCLAADAGASDAAEAGLADASPDAPDPADAPDEDAPADVASGDGASAD